MEFKKGSTLLDQIYKEGTPTWGCKSGVLDVEDVESLLTNLMDYAKHRDDWELKSLLKEWSGFSI